MLLLDLKLFNLISFAEFEKRDFEKKKDFKIFSGCRWKYF